MVSEQTNVLKSSPDSNIIKKDFSRVWPMKKESGWHVKWSHTSTVKTYVLRIS